MSLNVETYVYEANGEWILLGDPDDDYSKTMAGFERSRSKLWGSEAVRALGARFLPQLDGDNLQVEPAEIDDFLAECEAIRPHLDHLGEVSGMARSTSPDASTTSLPLPCEPKPRAAGSSSGELDLHALSVAEQAFTRIYRVCRSP